MIKHTAEPWVLLPEECDRPYIRIRGTIPGGRYKIANVITPVYEGVHEREAKETRCNAVRIVSCVNACEGMADPAAEIAELKRQRDELLAVISGIVEEVPHRHGSRGNAPGHGHDTPGVWDSDNGALAGKECGWCKAWRCAVEIYNKAKGTAA